MRCILLCLSILFLFAGTCSAALPQSNVSSYLPTRVAVVIVGSSDYKTEDYFQSIDEYICEPNKNKKLKILYGEDVQGKYQEYWLEKGELTEGTPTKQDLFDFVRYGGFDKVLYLIVQDPVIDRHQVRSGLFGQFTSEDIRASITVNCFLCDDGKVIKNAAAVKEDDSFASILRARRGAFGKCMQSISTTISPFLK